MTLWHFLYLEEVSLRCDVLRVKNFALSYKCVVVLVAEKQSCHESIFMNFESLNLESTEF